ncbi:MAG: sugar ABC transporter ATP-binding protein [Aggregatilineales bacterium]
MQASSDRPLVEFHNISKAFPGVQALDSVSFSIKRGRVHALLGANGAGKSTFIKILAGAVPRDTGDVIFDGVPVEIHNPQDAARLGIASIFQEPALIPLFSAEQNIFLGQEKTNRWGLIRRQAQHHRAVELMRPLAPHIDVRQPVNTLRTSERQLVALAKALLAGDKLVIMDEPSASMTDVEIQALFSAIGQLRASGVSVIYISHRLEEVFHIADDVTVLRDGKHIHTGPVAGLTRHQLVSLIVGHEVRVEERRTTYEAGDEVLIVESLSRANVFTDISFRVRAGEIVALAGLVGSGRSEIARGVLGADPTDGGTVIYPRGRKRVKQPADAIRAGVVMIPEDRKNQGIIPKMTVGDNMMLSSIRRYIYQFLGLIQSKLVQSAIQKHVDQLQIRPQGAEKRQIQTLSGGNQQKVLVARAIESEAALMIFDEPTAGVDIATKSEIHKLIIRLAEAGKGILLISSETEEVLTLADRILIVRNGRLVGEIEGHSATSAHIMARALGEEIQTRSEAS